MILSDLRLATVRLCTTPGVDDDASFVLLIKDDNGPSPPRWPAQQSASSRNTLPVYLTPDAVFSRASIGSPDSLLLELTSFMTALSALETEEVSRVHVDAVLLIL